MKQETKELLNVAGIVLVVGVLFILLCLQGCSPKCYPERVEVHDTILKTDSFYLEKVRDSIVYRWREDSTREYVRDSVSVRQKGDTIFIEKYHYSDKYKGASSTTEQSTSSSIKQDEKSADKQSKSETQVIVKKERYTPAFYVWGAWWLGITIALIVLRVAVWVCSKIPATKMYAEMVQSFVRKILNKII